MSWNFAEFFFTREENEGKNTRIRGITLLLLLLLEKLKVLYRKEAHCKNETWGGEGKANEGWKSK